MRIVEEGEQKSITNEGLAHKGPYQVEEAQYVNGNRSYKFKPNNNLPTHCTPALRNHETYHMEVECSRVQGQCRISNKIMLHMVSKDNNKAVIE